MFPQEAIEGFRRYWRRRKPHTSTVLHYASDVTLFFEWVKDVAPREISIHHIDQFIDWQRILTGLYGLGGAPTCTVEELSQQLGLTVERVRQLERHALSRLRRQGRRLVEYWR